MRDTGQWRLVVYITASGLRAYLKNVADGSLPIEEIASAQWGDVERKDILQKIEAAVYDNPDLMDDYATDIIVQTPRVAFAPSRLLDIEEYAEDMVFKSLFPGSDSEVSIDHIGDVAALYSLTAGLESFIARTIPGARMRSHLGVLAERFARKTSDAVRVYVDIRDGEADLLAFDRKKLLSVAVHSYAAPEDVAYHVLHLLRTYNIKVEDAEINVSGDAEVKARVIEILREICPYVVQTTLPAAGKELPLAARLLL